jgi:phage terminase large subunit-like protein
MGRPYMPWQQYIADVAGEVDHNGILCYKKVVVTVPRQSGKTTLILSVVIGRAEAGDRFGGRQTMYYAAQTREKAREKLTKEYIPEIAATKKLKGRYKSRIANGSEGVTFYASGSTLSLTATKIDSGHGSVLDFGCLDEAMSQVDDTVVGGAWEPATITRPMSQIWIPSPAGHAGSTYFRELVETARTAAETDSGYGIAYIEFSADEKAPGFDPYDEDLWRRTMPALGYTQTIEAVRSIAHGGMKLNTWKRAHLNIWVGKESPSVLDTDK